MTESIQQTLEQVTNAVLSEPVTLDVAITPQTRWEALLQRLRIRPKKRTLVLHPVTAGTLYRISKLLLTIDENLLDKEKFLESCYKASAAHHHTMVEVIALAIHNKRTAVPTALRRLIEEQFTPQALIKVLLVVLRQMDVKSFMISIASIRGLNILESPTANAQNANENEASPMTPR